MLFFTKVRKNFNKGEDDLQKRFLADREKAPGQ